VTEQGNLVAEYQYIALRQRVSKRFMVSPPGSLRLTRDADSREQ